MKYLLALFIAASVVSIAWTRARVLASLDIPVTSFSCAGRPIGYYADVENNCQTYHMCGDKGEMYSYACPNTTLFHQRMLICAHWYQVNCNRSSQDYSANLLIGQRDKPFVDEITANDLNGISSESFRKAALLGGREGKSNADQYRPTESDNSQYKQVTQNSQDLVEAPSGSFVADRLNSVTDRYPAYNGALPAVNQYYDTPQAPSRSTSTEPTGAGFRPTNVSFRSTIETPNSDSSLARTAPMASAQPFSRTESAFRLPGAVTTASPDRPSIELLPPLDESPEDTNTIEIRLEDPRRSHYIPSDGGQLPTGEPIVVSINLPGRSRFRPASPFAGTKESQVCPRCHPVFLVDRTNCSPCLLLRP